MIDRSPISGTPIQPDTFRHLSNVRRDHVASSDAVYGPAHAETLGAAEKLADLGE